MTFSLTLQRRNIGLSSEWQTDGVFGFGCHDLTQFGSTGSTIAASRGRYVWIVTPDHPVDAGWSAYVSTINLGTVDGSADCLIGYSNDPGIPPRVWKTLCTANYYHSGDARNAAYRYLYYHYNDFFYNPDDTTPYPFYLFMEGFPDPAAGLSGSSVHEGALFRSNDLVNWHGDGGLFLTTNNPASVGEPFTGFCAARRLSSTSWEAIGRGSRLALNVRWTASAATGTWTTNGTQLTNTLSSPTRIYGRPLGNLTTLNISGQDYMIMIEDARVNGAGGTGDGMFISLVAVDSGWNVLASPAPVRLSPSYPGNFPSFDYLQGLCWYKEDGIVHVWPFRGYATDTAGPTPAESQHVEAVDYWTGVYDATAAASAAPVGVRAECRQGAVILEWYDALPNRTYRVKRSTNGGSTYSNLADVTGVHYVDGPGGVNATYFYRVYTLNSGTEAGFRQVDVYVSNGRALTNKHATRALDASATNVDFGWLDACATMLRDNVWTDHCFIWTDPAFGVIKDGSSHVSRTFCLGSTLSPVSGDFWAVPTNTTTTTYVATGVNSAIPALQNDANTSFSYWGGEGHRYDIFTYLPELTIAVVYQKTHNNTISLVSNYGGTIYLNHTTGTPGTIEFGILLNLDKANALQFTVTATAIPSASTGPHIIIATLRGIEGGIEMIVNCDGVDGTPTNSVTDLFAIEGIRNRNGGRSILSSGSTNTHYNDYNPTVATTTLNYDTQSQTGFSFSNNEALFSVASIMMLDIGLTAAQRNTLYTFLHTRVGGASYSLPSLDAPFIKDVKVDYSAVGDGTTDDVSKFISFGTAALTWQATHAGLCVLNTPPGSYAFIANTISGGNQFADGVKNFLMIGDGPNLSGVICGATDAGMYFGARGGTAFLDGIRDHAARFATISAGATSITLIDDTTSSNLGTAATLIANFSVGQWVLLAGIDTQHGGDPANPLFHEYAKITNITGVVITLDRQTEYAYKSTWPHYAPGSHSAVPEWGGPATVYPFRPQWDAEFEYRGIKSTQPTPSAGGTKSCSRFVTLRDHEIESGAGLGNYPTESFHVIYDNVYAPVGGTEIDKYLGYVTHKSCTWHKIICFSASAQRLDILRGTAVDGNLEGTTKFTFMSDFYVGGTAFIGASSYGAADKLIARRGVIADMEVGGIGVGNINVSVGSGGYGATMSGGVITMPTSSYDAPSFLNPSYRNFWSGIAKQAIGSFRVLDITQSGTNVLIQTDTTGGFPPVTGAIGVRTHGAPAVMLRAVVDLIIDSTRSFVGLARDWSFAQPFVPLGSQNFRYFIPINMNTAHAYGTWGKLVSLTITTNASHPYTGANNNSGLPLSPPLLFHPLGQFGADYIDAHGNNPGWNPIIDINTQGTRIITPTSVTGTAIGVSGSLDANLAPPSGTFWCIPDVAWTNVNMNPDGTAAVSNPQGIIGVSLVLDQSALPFSGAGSGVMQLRFRLHA